MSKLHSTETCIGCGARIKLLIRENKKEWENFRNFIIEKPTIAKDAIMDVLTPRTMIHDEADIIYFLCPDCCRDALRQLLIQIIASHRRLLFQNFDKIKKELQNDL